MENHEGLDKLFFELASESRLDILWELRSNKRKMQEIAKKLDITDTEACRQIKRLSDELLIHKQPDGAYTISNYGKLILELLQPLEFVVKYKEYCLEHDFWKLPRIFIRRLDELSEGTLKTELAESVNGIQEMVQSADDHIWTITDQIIATHSYATASQLLKGVKSLTLVPERLSSSPLCQIAAGKNAGWRCMPEVPGVIMVTEKEAFVFLYMLEGKMDYEAFFGSDPAFIKWAEDLFNYFWEKGKPFYPKQKQ
jgi:predicted transcriptional regulator